MCDYYLDTINDRKKKLILQLQELLLTESVNFYKKRNIHWLSAPVTTGVISSPMGLGSDSKPVKILLDNKETYFNNLDCLPTVIDDIRDCIKQYKNPDGTYSIGTGCYIYEVKKR